MKSLMTLMNSFSVGSVRCQKRYLKMSAVICMLVVIGAFMVTASSEESLEPFLQSASPSRDLWLYAPADPATTLPSYSPWLEWHHLGRSEQQQLLTHLGIPLLIDFTNSFLLTALGETLAMLQYPGTCAHFGYQTSRGLFFLFHPQELQRWYSSERISQLRRYVTLSPEWETAIAGKYRSYLPIVTEAELAVARLESVAHQGPAVLPVTLFSFVLYRISVLDVGYEWEEDVTRAGLETIILRRPSLTLNAREPLERKGEQQRLKQKYRYQKRVDALNQLLHRAEKASASIFHKAAEQFEAKEKRKLHQRQSLAVLQEQQAERRKRENHQRTDDEARMLKSRELKNGIAKTHQQYTACYQLRRVGETLKAVEVGKTVQDQRYQLYQTLMQNHHCAGVELGSKKTIHSAADSTRNRHRKVVNICEHVEQFTRWNAETGFPHTVSQSLVLMLLLYAVEHRESSGTAAIHAEFTSRNLMQDILPFNASDFLAFISRVIRRGEYGLLDAGCAHELPPEVLAELWYFLSSVELLQGGVPCLDGGSSCSVQRGFGVLHLYQALWYGSRQAAGALATLREHGMFVPQHEKAAARLLHYSMLDTTNDIILQLLAKYSPNSTHLEDEKKGVNPITPQDSNAVTEEEDDEISWRSSGLISLNRLLRYERFFGWIGDGWYPVDHPHFTRRQLTQFLTLDDNDVPDEEEEDEGEVMKRDSNSLLKATVWLSGLHGVARDTRKAECRLLTILRLHGFVCDLQPELYGLRMNRDWDSLCPPHSTALSQMEGNPLIHCQWHQRPRGLPDALENGVYTTLQETLFKLSFMYMVEQKFELSSFYAMLNVELSLTFYASAVDAIQKNKDQTQWSPPWYALQLISEKPRGEDIIVSYTASSFATFKPLLLLALNRIVAPDARTKRLLDKIIRETLLQGFEVKDEDGSRDIPLVRIFMCLIASSAEESRKGKDREFLHYFDHNPNSIHEVDSFFTLVWLIGHLHRSNYPLSPHVLLDRSLIYQNLLGDWGSIHLPLLSDDWVSYACRLSGIATKIHRLAAMSLMRQLGLPCRPPVTYQVDREIISHLLDRFPFTFALQYLRHEKQYHIRHPKTRPLWFASDIHKYSNGIGQTKLSRFFDTLLNGAYYLVGDTTTESLLRQFGEAILPESGVQQKEKEEVRGTVANLAHSETSRSFFLGAFAVSENIQHFSIAVLLFANTLEIGTAQGFSLLFYAANEGKNPYLASISTFLARDMWGRVLVSMWREEHYVAQWHHEKNSIIRRNRRVTFSMDHHTPFLNTPQEIRQELMSRMNRWMTRSIRHEAASSTFTLQPHPQLGNVQHHSLEERVKQLLLLCSGYLTYLRDLDSSGTSHQYQQPTQLQYSPFTGSLFPAADLSCLEELLKEDKTPLSSAQREQFTADLQDAARRLQHYYRLSPQIVIDSLPSSSEKFCDTALLDTVEPEDAHIEPYFWVEPWAHSDTDSWSSPALGEGVYFNDRLHRVTGAQWASTLLWIRNTLARLRLWRPR